MHWCVRRFLDLKMVVDVNVDLNVDGNPDVHEWSCVSFFCLVSRVSCHVACVSCFASVCIRAGPRRSIQVSANLCTSEPIRASTYKSVMTNAHPQKSVRDRSSWRQVSAEAGLPQGPISINSCLHKESYTPRPTSARIGLHKSPCACVRVYVCESACVCE